MNKKAILLWMDLEMTGLDPEVDQILEVAAIATDWDLQPMAETEFGVQADPTLMKERMVGEFWEENARSRRELMKISADGITLAEAEEILLTFVKENFGAEVILAGNSIHQDRKFIDRYMPKLAKKLHYRMLDVSAWKVVMEGKYGKKFLKPEEHRALEDIKGSIKELSWYLDYVKLNNVGQDEDEEE